MFDSKKNRFIFQSADSKPGIYLFKVNNRNNRIIREVCSKLTIKTLERPQWRSSGVFIANFEQTSHIVPVFPWLTMNKCIPGGSLPWWESFRRTSVGKIQEKIVAEFVNL